MWNHSDGFDSTTTTKMTTAALIWSNTCPDIIFVTLFLYRVMVEFLVSFITFFNTHDAIS